MIGMEGNLWMIVLALVGLLGLVYAVYRLAYKPYQLFKRYGIPGPTPIPIFGNYFLLRRVGIMKIPEVMMKKYGLVFGLYIGRRPLMYIGDLEILKSIFIQQFNYFTDRETVPDFFYRSVGLPPGLFVAKGDEWKQSRFTIAPAFTSLNLKTLFPCIENTCHKLAESFGQHADSGFSVRVDKLYGRFTMECIMAMMFGESADTYKTEKETFIKTSEILFTAADERLILLFWLLHSHLSLLEPMCGFLMKNTWRGRYFNDLYEACTKLVLAYTTTPSKSKCILQLMADVSVGKKKRKLTVEEMVSHIITFLMAGYESTSATMSYTSYLLALNPTVQEKVHEEIVNYFKNNPNASLSDAAKDIEYVDMAIQESLRIFPPSPGTTRLCSETITINGVTIPGGTLVLAPTLQLQHSSKYWRDPEKFIPERFSAEEKAKRPPLCYMPFGVGPRNCIGLRFAMMELKMMLVQVLRSYKFEIAPETQIPVQTVFRFTIAPKDGIYLKLVSW